MPQIKLSVLELATVLENQTIGDAIHNVVEIAQHADDLGYNRLWMAEHHNMPHIASSATAVLIGHVAGQTKNIKVGSGGIMLPNHSPLVIAEQFGTLESIYPNRIDLGLGRAPGTDQLTAKALRKHNYNFSYDFASEITQLQQFFDSENCTAKVRAFPGEGLNIPIYILGSSTDSAYLAAQFGLPYAFASHFAPALLFDALRIYRDNFKPSKFLKDPYVIACVNVIAADTDEEARLLSSSLIQLYAGVIIGDFKPLAPPCVLSEIYNHPQIKNAIDNMMTFSFIGSKESIKEDLDEFIAQTQIDELMITGYIYDLSAKKKSFSIMKEIYG